MACPEPYFEWELPYIPKCKKNNYVPRRAGSRIWVAPSREVQREAEELGGLARMEMGATPMIPKENGIWMDTDIVIRKKADNFVVVRFFDLGAFPTLGTKFDIDGTATTIADFMQGVLYYDDRKIERMTIRRVRDDD